MKTIQTLLLLLLISQAALGQTPAANLNLSTIDTSGRWVHDESKRWMPNRIINANGDTLAIEYLRGNYAIADDNGLIKPPAYRYVNLSTQPMSLTRKQYYNLVHWLQKLDQRPKTGYGVSQQIDDEVRSYQRKYER